MLKLPPPHQLPTFLPTFSFLSLSDGQVVSILLSVEGWGRRTLNKVIRDQIAAAPPSLCPCSAQPQSSFKRKYILSVPPQSPDSYGELGVKYCGGSKNILLTSMLRHWNKQIQRWDQNDTYWFSKQISKIGNISSYETTCPEPECKTWFGFGWSEDKQ